MGIFHDRIGEGLTLDARRYDGERQQSFLVTDPVVLDQLSFDGAAVTGTPVDRRPADATPCHRRCAIVDPEIETPRTTQWSFSIERALPGNLSLVANYIGTRIDRALRSRVLGDPVSAQTEPRSRASTSTSRRDASGRTRSFWDSTAG